MNQSFSHTVVSAWKHQHLLSALIELTYHCNLDCFFCYNDRSIKEVPLDMADYERLLSDLEELQCPMVVLTGGEPLSSPHFFNLGALAHKKGFSIRIKSNGHSWTPSIAARIKREMDPFLVEVSLHGADAETHDKQTRKKGSFTRLIKNLRTMKDTGLRLRLNATLTAYNEKQIAEMFEIADSIGIFLRFDPEVTPRDDGSSEPLSISPSSEGLAQLLNIESKRSKNAPSPPSIASSSPVPKPDRHCGAGSSGIVVDPFGQILPCVQWRVPIGNLRNESLLDIWQGKQVAAIRNQSKAVKVWLDDMPRDAKPNVFCPGVALQRTGSTTQFHAGVAQRQKEIQDHKVRLKVLQ